MYQAVEQTYKQKKKMYMKCKKKKLVKMLIECNRMLSVILESKRLHGRIGFSRYDIM